MKFLFLISLLSFLMIACSDGKDQATATGSGAGIERQQDSDGQTPGFEKEQYRNDYKADDANITTPIDSRPDLEEEE